LNGTQANSSQTTTTTKGPNNIAPDSISPNGTNGTDATSQATKSEDLPERAKRKLGKKPEDADESTVEKPKVENNVNIKPNISKQPANFGDRKDSLSNSAANSTVKSDSETGKNGADPKALSPQLQNKPDNVKNSPQPDGLQSNAKSSANASSNSSAQSGVERKTENQVSISSMFYMRVFRMKVW